MSSKILIGTNNSLFVRAFVKKLENASVDVTLCENTRESILKALENESFDMAYIYSLREKASLGELIGTIHSRFPEIEILASVYSEAYGIIDKLTLSDRVKCVVMPVSVERLTEIVRRVLEPKRSGIYSYIADYLYILGLRRNYNGFSYLCSAIALCLDDPTRLGAVVKRVYAAVGEEYGVEGTIIDRSMRHLSKAVFEDGLVPALTCGQLNEKLNNYELICSAADRFVNSRMMKIKK